MTKFLTIALCLGISLGAFASYVFAPASSASAVSVPVSERVYSEKVHVVGYVRDNGGRVFLSLSDGRTVQPKNTVVGVGGAIEAEITAGVWVKGSL